MSIRMNATLQLRGIAMAYSTSLDAANLAAIERSAHEHPLSARQIREHLRHSLTLGYQINMRVSRYPVAYALMTYAERHVFLHRIAVAPAMQRQGLGTLLLDAVARNVHSLRRGGQPLVTQVCETDEDAVRWFARKGFQATLIRDVYRRHGVMRDAYRFELRPRRAPDGSPPTR